MLSHFLKPWSEVPLVLIDTETTGTRPGTDRAVQVGIARFENGVELSKAHDAAADAAAAGHLFYKLMPQIAGREIKTLGHLLLWQRKQEAEDWFRFSDWRAQQPPLPAEG
jgi:DNA polymerase III epsilon subunit-like protein